MKLFFWMLALALYELAAPIALTALWAILWDNVSQRGKKQEEK